MIKKEPSQFNLERGEGMSESEREQTPEQIKVLVKEAFEKQLLVDLTIENPTKPTSMTPDCLIEQMEGEDLMITYLEADGELGPLISVGLTRIKRITLKDPFKPQE